MKKLQTLLNLLQRNVFQKDINNADKRKTQRVAANGRFKINDGRFFYPLQHVLRFFSLKDLFNLARSSRYLSYCVEEYCKLICQQLDFGKELDLSLCSQFLLQKDHILQNRLTDDKSSYITRYTIYTRLKR